MASRGSYVHKSMVQFSGMLVLCSFLKILMVSDKNDSLLELIKLYIKNKTH